MLDIIIGGPANMFIWIVCLVIGFKAALVFADVIKTKNKN